MSHIKFNFIKKDNAKGRMEGRRKKIEGMEKEERVLQSVEKFFVPFFSNVGFSKL